MASEANDREPAAFDKVVADAMVSVLVLGLLFVVFATPLIFLIDND